MGKNSKTIDQVMDPHLKQKIERSLAAHPEYPNGRISHNLNTTVANVAAVREELGIPPAAGRGRKRGNPKGKTLEEFRGKHDISLIIRRNVDQVLHEECQEYFEDADFRSICDVPASKWRRHADSDEFASYRIKRGSLNVWANPQVIETMKRILSI